MATPHLVKKDGHLVKRDGHIADICCGCGCPTQTCFGCTIPVHPAWSFSGITVPTCQSTAGCDTRGFSGSDCTCPDECLCDGGSSGGDSCPDTCGHKYYFPDADDPGGGIREPATNVRPYLNGIFDFGSDLGGCNVTGAPAFAPDGTLFGYDSNQCCSGVGACIDSLSLAFGANASVFPSLVINGDGTITVAMYGNWNTGTGIGICFFYATVSCPDSFPVTIADDGTAVGTCVSAGVIKVASGGSVTISCAP